MLSWVHQAIKLLADENKADEDEFATRIPYHIEPEYIPDTLREFYYDFGKLRHQITGQIIEDLAPYQYEAGDCPALTVLVDKCQKSGFTTSELIHDFKETISVGRGKDCLIVAQTQQHANEHIYTLKRMIADSVKYRKYLITSSKELFFREEQTKLSTIFIKNPDNPFRPSRIIGLPFRQQSLWSWKNVFRVHISDPAISQVVDDASVYAAAKGRLANSNGQMMIEGPPSGPRGKFYEWYEEYKDNHDPNFKVFLIIDDDAVKANVISQEFLDQQKKELGPLYAQYYQGSFISGVGNVFAELDINYAIKLGDFYKNLDVNQYTYHFGGIDPGWAKITPLYIFEIMKEEEVARLVYYEEFDKSTPEVVANKMHRLSNMYINLWWMLDGADRGFVNTCKYKFRENQNWTDGRDVSPQQNKIIPVNFRVDHGRMLENLYMLLAAGHLAIPEELGSRLILALRTAKADRWYLDKNQTSNDDDLDSARLALRSVKFGSEI
jgi:hypothetical protein